MEVERLGLLGISPHPQDHPQGQVGLQLVVQTRRMSPKAASEGWKCVTLACCCSSSGGIRDGFFLAKSGHLGAEVLNQKRFAPWSLGRIWRHAYLPRLVGGQKHSQVACRGGRHLPHHLAPSIGRAEVERLS